jgi:DNA-binding MarR family transcriptional regulator
MPEFDKLDPLLHSQLRLAIMSILISGESADFVYLKEKTGATAGNLSVQVDKLAEAGYIQVKKGYLGKRPQTSCSITKVGIAAFEAYVEALKQYIAPITSPETRS